jgi:ankyrin repeat protein
MKTRAYVYGVEKLNGHDLWALFQACAQGNLAKVKALLAKDRRLVNGQYWYQFPIHMAVSAGQAEVVELLLDRGADPGQSRCTYDSWDKLLQRARERGYRRVETLLVRAMRRRFNYSAEFAPLKQAIIARDGRAIDGILRRQPALARASDAFGSNPLHWSVITRQLGLIDRFVAAGTPIDAQRADGQTPVLLAANGGCDYWYRESRGRSHPSLRNAAVMVGSLLAHGAEYTLSVAAAMGDLERVREVLRRDRRAAGRLDSARTSPLAHAAAGGHAHIVHELLKQGADPNQAEEGSPRGGALFEACKGNHLAMAERLLEDGADPNAGVDSCGCCLTIVEVYHGSRARPMQALLRRNGASDPPYAMSARAMARAIRRGDKVTSHSEFAVHLLAKRDRKLTELYFDSLPNLRSWQGPLPNSAVQVRRLLQRGLNPNRSDWQGRTLLHTCAQSGDRNLAALLLDAGADINARDLEFKGTPLAAAARSWCGETAPEQAGRRRRMVEFLLRRGAATNLPGDEPWATPLAWAMRHDQRELAGLLRRHGAR